MLGQLIHPMPITLSRCCSFWPRSLWGTICSFIFVNLFSQQKKNINYISVFSLPCQHRVIKSLVISHVWEAGPFHAYHFDQGAVVPQPCGLQTRCKAWVLSQDMVIQSLVISHAWGSWSITCLSLHPNAVVPGQSHCVVFRPDARPGSCLKTWSSNH